MSTHAKLIAKTNEEDSTLKSERVDLEQECVAGLVDSEEESPAATAKRSKLLDESNYQHGMLMDEADSYKMPLHMRQLIDNMVTADTTEEFYLLILVYVVAVEMGFCTNEEARKMESELQETTAFHAENVREITKLPITFQCSKECFQCYFINLKFLGYTEYQKESLSSKMMAVFEGDNLVVTLTPPKSFEDAGYSCLLQVADHVKKGNGNQLQLFNLKELSYKLRKELFQPLKASYLYWFKVLPSTASFVMHSIIFTPVFKHLKQRDLGRLAQVNRDFRDAVYYFRRMEKKSQDFEIFI